ELRPSFHKHRVSADVHPIVLLGWHVTQLAVGLVVRRHVASRLLRLEQGPTPAVAPQVVAGNRPFESLIITNQILMSVVQWDSPVVSFAEPTWVTSFTSTAPSGNLPSRRYARTSSGRAYTTCISSSGLSGFVATAYEPRYSKVSR